MINKIVGGAVYDTTNGIFCVNCAFIKRGDCENDLTSDNGKTCGLNQATIYKFNAKKTRLLKIRDIFNHG